jgi:hypothetical protein
MNEKWIKNVNEAHLPSWFKCRLFEASTGRIFTVQGNFRTGYGDVGKSLGLGVEAIVDDETALANLDTCLRNPEAITAWVKKNLGGFLRLVPSRKREAFITGFAEGRSSAV